MRNIESLTDVDIYKLVLQRKLLKFPRQFWEKPHSLDSAREITIYLIEDLLKWTEEDVKKNLCQKTFRENSLGGMTKVLFKCSPYKTLNNAYPSKFKPWELNITPSRFWNETTSYEFVKWIIEEKYKWDDEEIKENFSKTMIVALGFDRPMDFIKEDTFGIIDKLYPNKFKPWELKQVAIDYWDSETLGNALKWLIEDKLKLDIEKDKVKITNDFLNNNGMERLTAYIYKKKISIFELIQMAYGDKYKEWEITNMDIWTEEKKAEAMKWLVEDKLKFNPLIDLPFVKTRHFKEYDLLGLLGSFENSPTEALKFAYPKNKQNRREK